MMKIKSLPEHKIADQKGPVLVAGPIVVVKLFWLGPVAV